MDILEVLKKAVSKGASDIHISSGRKPTARINGEIINLDFPLLSRDEAKRVIYGILPDSQRLRFEQENELDCALVVSAYKYKDKPTGRVAVLGPKRMKYAKVVSAVEYLSELITELLNDF